jgi:hypothetical protein
MPLARRGGSVGNQEGPIVMHEHLGSQDAFVGDEHAGTSGLILGMGLVATVVALPLLPLALVGSLLVRPVTATVHRTATAVAALRSTVSPQPTAPPVAPHRRLAA